MSLTMWTQARAIATQSNNKLYTAQSTTQRLPCSTALVHHPKNVDVTKVSTQHIYP